MMLSRLPAAPAMNAPIANVTACIRMTSTPISAAASRSIRIAMIARPSLLSRNKGTDRRSQKCKDHHCNPIKRQHNRAEEMSRAVDRVPLFGNRP